GRREVPRAVRGARLPGAADRRHRLRAGARGAGHLHRLGGRAARDLAGHAPGRVRPDGHRAGRMTSTDTVHTDEEDYGDLGERRQRRIRVVAWVTIVALIVTGGGATALTLLLG